ERGGPAPRSGRARNDGRGRRRRRRPMKAPAFTLGVEEEYLVVDRTTRDLVEDLPATMLTQCKSRIDGQQVKPEFMRAQIEIGTRICNSLAEVRDSLTVLRGAVIDVADEHG